MKMQIVWASIAIAAATLAVNGAQAYAPHHDTTGTQSSTMSVVFAKNGADNKAGDRGGKARGGEGANHASIATSPSIVLARNGADNGAGHEAGEHARGDNHGAHHR